jgi:hypothetical protein
MQDMRQRLDPRISLQCAVPRTLNGGNQRVIFSALSVIYYDAPNGLPGSVSIYQY